MKVRLSVVQPDDLAVIIPRVSDLRNAVNAGDMAGVDAVTEELMVLTTKMHSVNISEKDWRRFLADIRIQNPAFQSDYLVSGELYGPFFPNIGHDKMILQFPFDDREEDDV